MGNQSETQDNKRSWTHWFEIPVSDFDRAKSFYETLFEIEIQAINFGSFKMGIFPHSDVGCAIVSGEGYTPGAQGAIVYLNAGPDLQVVADRVEKAGGKIIQDKKQISEEYGYMALFLDCEGNKMALHSVK
ncbi:MAG: VOC family protein [candidate division Zixibacteria bacterium]|nr:VOC family protein [candidate division Zixibacteria bacterium]